MENVSFCDAETNDAFHYVTGIEGMTPEVANHILNHPALGKENFARDAVRAFRAGVRNDERVLGRLEPDVISEEDAQRFFNKGREVTREKANAEESLAYRYGKQNYKEGLKNLKLSESQADAAFQMGRKAAAEEVSPTKQASTESTVGKSNTRKTIHFDNFTYNKHQLNEAQRASMKAIDFINKMSSLEIHVYKSFVRDGKRYTTINGKERLAPNGYFVSGNQIHIDLYAGNMGEGTMLFTMAHEIGHYIAQWNAQDFKSISDFLFEHYAKDVPIDDMLDKKIQLVKKTYKLDGKELPSEAQIEKEAQEELVCDMLANMLADKHAYEVLADLKQKDLKLHQKLGRIIKKLLHKLGEMLGVYDVLNPDAKFVASVENFGEDAFRQLQDLYIKAFVQADANFQAAQEQISTKKSEKVLLAEQENVKYSDTRFFPDNVFPSGLIHSAVTHWANRKDVQIGDSRLETYKGYYYRVQKFDDSDFGYRITKKYNSQNYEEVLKEYEKDNSRKSIQERIDRVDALYRGSVEYGKKRHHAGSSGDEYRGEDLPILSVDQNATERRNNRSDAEGNRQDGLRDQRQTGRESLVWTPQELYDKMLDLDRKLVFAEGRYATTLKNRRDRYGRMIDDMNGWDQVRLSERDSDVDFQERTEDSVSNRSLLANAFEGSVSDELELEKLQEYKEMISLMDDQEKKLQEVKRQIKRLTFDGGAVNESVKKLVEAETTVHTDRAGNAVIEKGTKVRVTDRNNIGTVMDYNADTGNYIVAFRNKYGLPATKNISSDMVSPLYKKTSAKQRKIFTEIDNNQKKLDALNLQIEDLKKTGSNPNKIKLLETKASGLTNAIKKQYVQILKDEATKTANRINIYDSQLLMLEAAKPLQNLLSREKQKAYERAKAKGREYLAEYRNNSAKRQMTGKIQRVVNELNDLLLSDDKKRHVPDNLKKAVAGALDILNLDTSNTEERVAKYEKLIAEETDPDKIDAYQVTLENILRAGEKMGEKLGQLHAAYKAILTSNDPDIQHGYDASIADAIAELSETIGDTPISKMSMEQLEDVYNVYKAVLTRVRDANRSLIESASASIADRSHAVMSQVKKVGGERTHRAAAMDAVKKASWDNVYSMRNHANEHKKTSTFLWRLSVRITYLPRGAKRALPVADKAS